MFNLLALLQLFVLLLISGCAKTVSYSQLKLDQDSVSSENTFSKLTGTKNYNVVFQYSPEPGTIEIKDVIIGSISEPYVSEFLMNNQSLLEKEKKIIDCLTIKYSKTDSPTYSACTFNKDPKSLSVFTKNDVDVSDGIAGTIVSPLALALTVLGEPTNPYKGTVNLIVNQDAINSFGRVVNSKLGAEAQSSCKVTDSSLIGWYRGGCANGKANGLGTAIGRDKYVGNFVDGAAQGRGLYSWSNGDSYDGEFSKNELNGKGAFKWHSGESYIGGFVNGNRTGNGEYTYKDGKTLKGFFLDNKLLSESEYAEYRCKIDPIFEKEYRHKQYVDAFVAAKSSKDFDTFITKYSTNDPDNLIPQAKNKRVMALRDEIKEELNKAKNSYDYEEFINRNKSYDPDKLIPKAKQLKADALRREKENYDNVMSSYNSGNYKIKVTYSTTSGRAINVLEKVKAAVHVRDPFGIWNPFWVPSFHASAAYNDKGVVVGEWYTASYDGWNTWGKYFTPAMEGITGVTGWDAKPLGSTGGNNSGGGGGESWCYNVRDKDIMNTCLAQFKGESWCYNVRDKDMMNECLATTKGESWCYNIRDKDTMNSCLAQFKGESWCYNVRDKDSMNTCLAQYKGKSWCYNIGNKDMMNACIAQCK